MQKKKCKLFGHTRISSQQNSIFALNPTRIQWLLACRCRSTKDVILLLHLYQFRVRVSATVWKLYVCRKYSDRYTDCEIGDRYLLYRCVCRCYTAGSPSLIHSIYIEQVINIYFIVLSHVHNHGFHWFPRGCFIYTTCVRACIDIFIIYKRNQESSSMCTCIV